MTLASIGDGVIRTDAAGRRRLPEPGRRAADRLERRRGLRPAGRRGLQRRRRGRRGKPLPNPVERCLREGRGRSSCPATRCCVRRDGGEFADPRLGARRSATARAGSPARVLVFKDVTQLRGMEREMIYLARHDPLTGLINRREFEQPPPALPEHGPRRGPPARPLLPRPRRVQGGQRHLRPPGRRRDAQAGHRACSRAQLRETDILARLGGDEFGVLLRGRLARRAPRQVGRGAAHARSSSSASPGRSGSSRSACASAWCRSRRRAPTWPRSSRPPTPPATWPRRAAATAIHEYQPDDTALAERYGEMQWIHRIHKAFEEHRFCLYQQRIQPLAPAATSRRSARSSSAWSTRTAASPRPAPSSPPPSATT